MQLFALAALAAAVVSPTTIAAAASPAFGSTRELLSLASDVAPNCVQENNVDYMGNDLLNKPGASTDCCKLCDDSFGCSAWTWSNHNNGTCWLKGGRGTVVRTNGVVSGVKLAPSQLYPCGDLEYKTDYVGFDIGSVRMLKPADCCLECSNFPGCYAFTHTTHNGGTCWLKSQKGRMVYNPDATSSVSYGVSTAASCGVEAGVDYPGNDIGYSFAMTPSLCCQFCEYISPGCKAFSWTAQSGGTCYFKNRKGDAVAKAGVHSCQVLPNPRAPSCVMELGTDYVGNDIGNAASADSYGCCSICMKTAGCKAFSWTSQSGGTCWLKSGKGVAVANANVQSSVV